MPPPFPGVRTASAALLRAQALLGARRASVSAQVDEARTYGRYALFAGLAGTLDALDEALGAARLACSEDCRAQVGRALVLNFAQSQAACDAARDEAIAAGRFDEVSRHDGRGTGFLMALRVAQDVFQAGHDD